MRKLVPLAVALLLAGAGAGCRPNTPMWSPCTPGGDPTATDGHYVLVCKDGAWQPVMTVDEFVRIRRGEHVVIGPLPTRPTTTTTAPATTTTAGPTTSTTAASTTSTTAASTTTTTSTSTTTTTLPPTPTLSGVSPSTGPAAGGTSVTLTGTNFTDTTIVTFGGAPATFTVDTPTQITAVTPAHTAGSVDVVVTKTSGDATLFNAFTYV
jgi:hypothetical protein